MITLQEARNALHYNQYRREGSKELFTQMKESGLVAVFGASDDLIEFEGAISDEVGAYGGGKAFITNKGLLINECDDDRCPYFESAQEKAPFIQAVWGPKHIDASWAYETTIPHKKFLIMEDDEIYCEGIIFYLNYLEDVK